MRKHDNNWSFKEIDETLSGTVLIMTKIRRKKDKK